MPKLPKVPGRGESIKHTPKRRTPTSTRQGPRTTRRGFFSSRPESTSTESQGGDTWSDGTDWPDESDESMETSFDFEDENELKDVLLRDCNSSCLGSGVIEIVCKQRLDEMIQESTKGGKHYMEFSLRNHYQNELRVATEHAIDKMNGKEYIELLLNLFPEGNRNLIKVTFKNDLLAISNRKDACLQHGERFNLAKETATLESFRDSDFDTSSDLEQQSVPLPFLPIDAIISVMKYSFGIRDPEPFSSRKHIYKLAKELENNLTTKTIPLDEANEVIPSIFHKMLSELLDRLIPKVSVHTDPCPSAILITFKQAMPEVGGLLEKGVDYGTLSILRSKIDKVINLADTTYRIMVLHNCQKENENGEIVIDAQKLNENLQNPFYKILAMLIALAFAMILIEILRQTIKDDLEKAENQFEQFFDPESKLIKELQETLAKQMKEMTDLQNTITDKKYERSNCEIAKDYLNWNNSTQNYLYSFVLDYTLDSFCKDHHKLDLEKDAQKIANVKKKVDSLREFKDPIKHAEQEINQLDQNIEELTKKLLKVVQNIDKTKTKVEEIRKELQEKLQRADDILQRGAPLL